MMTPERASESPSAQREADHTAGALSGLVVADFSRVLAGPLATMMLGDLGATVIKVEEPGRGDDTRAWGPPYVDGESTYYLSINRNKRSIALDLRTAEGAESARTLAARADVMVENFRAGRLAEYALDYDSVAQTNPGVVYCSISGFGSGAGSTLAGYDFIAQAVGGLMSITGTEEGPPTRVGVAVVDILTGLHACIGIIGRTGGPARNWSGSTSRGESPLERHRFTHQSRVGLRQYRVGAARHGKSGTRASCPIRRSPRPTASSPSPWATTAQFRSLCSLVGLPELGVDERFRRQRRAGAEPHRAHRAFWSRHWRPILPRGGPCG